MGFSHLYIRQHKTATSTLQAIAVARLVPAKGFDLLVQAWQGIDAKLWIVGDGPDRDLLQEKFSSML